MVTGLEAIDLEKDYIEKSLGSFMFYFDKGKQCKDATFDDGRYARLLNHSFLNPNLKPFKHVVENQPRIIFKAIQDIECNSELVYDYGENNKSTIALLPWYKTS